MPVGTSVAVVAAGPATAMAMTYVAMAGSIGIAMQNAVVNQQNGQRVATAAVVQVCAMMLAAGIAEATHG